MATYFGTSINDSPTITLPAKEKIENAQGIALAVSNGELTKPTAGANVIGIALLTNDEIVSAGYDITVQIKEIGKWTAGEAFEIGDELTTNAEGKAVKATTGNFITAIALTNATADGDIVNVQIIKAGYKS
nr:MAG TPA: capsid fiber protein [Caudoviricetes sp.]